MSALQLLVLAIGITLFGAGATTLSRFYWRKQAEESGDPSHYYPDISTSVSWGPQLDACRFLFTPRANPKEERLRRRVLILEGLGVSLLLFGNCFVR